MILTEKEWLGLESIEGVLVHKQRQKAEDVPHDQRQNRSNTEQTHCLRVWRVVDRLQRFCLDLIRGRHVGRVSPMRKRLSHESTSMQNIHEDIYAWRWTLWAPCWYIFFVMSSSSSLQQKYTSSLFSIFHQIFESCTNVQIVSDNTKDEEIINTNHVRYECLTALKNSKVGHNTPRIQPPRSKPPLYGQGRMQITLSK